MISIKRITETRVGILSLEALLYSVPRSISRFADVRVGRSENYVSETHTYQHSVFGCCGSNQKGHVRYVRYKTMCCIPFVATVGRWGPADLGGDTEPWELISSTICV